MIAAAMNVLPLAVHTGQLGKSPNFFFDNSYDFREKRKKINDLSSSRLHHEVVNVMIIHQADFGSSSSHTRKRIQTFHSDIRT